jgi:hypothetical protein
MVVIAVPPAILHLKQSGVFQCGECGALPALAPSWRSRARRKHQLEEEVKNTPKKKTVKTRKSSARSQVLRVLTLDEIELARGGNHGGDGGDYASGDWGAGGYTGDN